MSIFWNLSHENRMGRLSNDTTRAENKASLAIDQMVSVEAKLNTITLACQAMWELLQESQGLTNDQLQQKMEEVDLRDGKLDGRMTPTVETCTKCGRKTSRRRTNCLYCGETLPDSEVFGKRPL